MFIYITDEEAESENMDCQEKREFSISVFIDYDWKSTYRTII